MLSKELNAMAEEGVIALSYGRSDLLSIEALQRLGSATQPRAPTEPASPRRRVRPLQGGAEPHEVGEDGG